MVEVRSNIAKYFLTAFIANLICCLFFTSNLRAQAVPITTDSRIKTLVYNSNEVYELKFYYGYQSFIEFSEGEEIEMISIGESFAWKITPAQKRLFIRPLEIAAHTNMTVITNKRTYHFDIKSGEYDGREDEELVYTVRFYYPQIGQPLPIPPQLAAPTPPKYDQSRLRPPPSNGRGPALRGSPMLRPETKTLSPSLDINDSKTDANVMAIDGNPEGLPLNFDYSLAGSSRELVPLKVYDNSRETFFQFPKDNISVPTISSVGPFGNENPVKYIIQDGYVIVPTVERQFTLREGGRLICVFNNVLIN